MASKTKRAGLALVTVGFAGGAWWWLSARAPTPPGGVVLVVPSDADALTQRQQESTARYLSTIAARPVPTVAVDPATVDELADLEQVAREHEAGLVVVLEADRLATDRVDADRMAALGEWGFVVEAVDVGDFSSALTDDEAGATVVLTAGAGRLARQYAAYELLRRLGVRFFHPEQEYVPEHAPQDLRDLARRPTLLHRPGADYGPDFDHRSWSFHKAHPLEHLEAFGDPDHPIDEAVHVIDWTVKNFGNGFRGAGRTTVDEQARRRRVAELDELRRLLGFSRSAGISMHNLQQGASAEIDPESDTPVREQIETLVARRLEQTPDARTFGIHFGVTEFTTTDDEQTVQWLTWAGEAALRHKPDVRVEINNHITGGQPSPNFDDRGCPNGTNDQGRIDYYDLPFHTDPRLGVKVHTVMFYPLEGPAGVYNQRSFAHKLCLMKDAVAQGRPLLWFPEGSWWLSFDNPIPVYLPLYMWTRARDIELLRPLLATRGGTVYGHRMFNSGQEWGYWQQDYAVGLMAWNADVTLPAVLGEIFDPLCEPAAWREGCDARTEAIAVLQEVIDHQRAMFLEQTDVQGRAGGRYTYFAGEDDADVIAADSGLEFRPVRLAFGTVLGWDEAQLQRFEDGDLAALHDAAARYEGWGARLAALADAVPAAGRPWLDEVRDGVEIDGLRAAQAAWLYEGIVRLRQAQLAAQAQPADAARDGLRRATEVLERAQQVIRRREQAYRYPAAQTHGGGLTPDTAVPNGTTYGFRVHTRTHLLTYWHNRHDEVVRIIEGARRSGLQLAEAMAPPGSPLSVTWPSTVPSDAEIAVGAQALTPSTESIELGEGAGLWPVHGPSPGFVVRSAVQATTPKKGTSLELPEDRNARRVLRSVMPPIRWAWVADPPTLALAPDPDGDGSVPHDAIVRAPARVDAAGPGFSTEPVAFSLPIALGSGGARLDVHVTDAVITGRVEGGALVGPLSIEARISVDDLVAAAAELAGFDRKGMVMILSRIWDFDAAEPPTAVPIRGSLRVVEAQ